NPQMKDELKAAFTAANHTATVDVYQANHGWCVKGGQAYHEAEAERAWTNLSQLYKTSLV
ncbi:MAG: dienelactone hydrolase family protein, partial [Rhizomicrobium sp.]